MKVVTVTIAIQPPDPGEADRDWNEVAKAARLVAHDATAQGLPTDGAQATIPVSGRTTAYMSVIELEEPE
jgi:hypothetical protein